MLAPAPRSGQEKLRRHPQPGGAGGGGRSECLPAPKGPQKVAVGGAQRNHRFSIVKLGPESRSRVHEYLGGAIRGMEGVAHAVGGTGDHEHLLAGLKATHRLADVLRELKSESSAWVRRELGLSGFSWQEGYGAFTLGASGIESARAYVLNQAVHHRTRTFQEEYVEFLKRGMVEFEEKWLW